MRCDNDIQYEKTLSDRLVLFLSGLYFILKPFYFWSSGLPQFSDFVLLLMMVFYLYKEEFIIRFYRQSKAFLFISLGFVIYVLFINNIWSLMLNGDLGFFKASSFYIYNFLAGLMILMLHYKYNDDLYKIIYISLLLSVFIQLAIFLISGGFSGTRALGSFNNPNQLGYHNLLMLAFIIITGQRQKVRTWLFFSSIFASLIMCFSSLSKAAIISYSGMLVYFLFMKIVTKSTDKRIAIYILLIMFILSAAYYLNREVIVSNQLYKSVAYRITRVGSDKDDNLRGRGYDRLAKYPQYLVFGSGEGKSSRFGYYIEFHSTLGNILMSYGTLGLVLYLTSVILAIKNSRWKDAYTVFFILLYGLTHNGIRNTLLWMLVASISASDAGTDTADHISLRRDVLFYERIY